MGRPGEVIFLVLSLFTIGISKFSSTSGDSELFSTGGKVNDYSGACKGGLYHGYGNLSYSDGGLYSGEWRNGERNGNGTIEFSVDDVKGRKTYTGKWRNDVIEGFGEMMWQEDNPDNETSYVGYFQNGVKHGFGTIVWQNGDTYTGDIIYDKRTGNGTYRWSNGDSYNGEFYEDNFSGSGTQTWDNGDSYFGEYYENKRTGNGTYHWDNGDSYTGEFFENKLSGYGTYNYSDGTRYEGQFRHGNFNGNGSKIFEGGDVYAGEFKDGTFDGFGSYKFINGNMYIGRWKKGEKNGNGTFHSKYGTMYDGVWEDGKLISVSKLEYHHKKSEDNQTNKCVTEKKGPNDDSVFIPWYIKSEDKTDMRVWNVWSKGITGKGVVVSVVDDGVSRCHPSIASNFDMKASYDFTDEDDDPSPETSDDSQGTKGASIIAARRNEPVCTIGVAYQASIGGIRMLQDPVTDLKEAKSLSFGKKYIDIFQISWGPTDDGKTFDGPGPLTRHVLTDGANNGRNGLGSIFVLASGTGGSKDDDCNADGYATSIYTMAISSVDKNNTRPHFSERCSAILATAYSGERRIGTGLAASAISVDSCSLHDGTAASASIGTGIVALMLEANPSLSWRDVQHITVLSAQSKRLLQADTWLENGAGLMVSNSFGFGVMNAEKMVERAQHWVPVDEQKVCITLAILEDDREIKVSVNCSEVSKLEHVQLDVKINVDDVRRGDIAITLSSPSGTKSIMMSERRNDRSVRGFDTQHWPLMSTHFWGEDPNGNWSITFSTGGKPFNKFDADFAVNCYGTSDN